MDSEDRYKEFFNKAMGWDSRDTQRGPYLYQIRLATDSTFPDLLDIPTGLGKTAAIVLAWLWHRRFDERFRNETPRRLVYCLPMRALVEQTRNNVRLWLERLGLAELVGVQILMGGEDDGDWDLYPERDAILIGTQDMLISRVLNRGYGMSRYRWPMHFGLLNNDCMWVFDEVQLMSTGLATSSQLAAFRKALGNGFDERTGVRSLWMSATLDRTWLKTVDFDPAGLGEPLRLSEQDKASSPVFKARKPLEKARSTIGDSKSLAGEVISTHDRSRGRTLVVVNTVRRAKDLYQCMEKLQPAAKLVLIHSRFRPKDREEKVRQLLTDPPPKGAIIVSTQVVEAGVDISAKTLFTELAPWASLVQRFGRCNRRGEHQSNELAQVIWIDLPEDEKARAECAPPYGLSDLKAARELVGQCKEGVGPMALEQIEARLSFVHTHVVRRKDLIELFDTTPDLAGNDIDIDRYVRDSESSDVRVFWRDLSDEPPSKDEPLPAREELCPVPIGEFRKFAETLGKTGARVYRRNFLDRIWELVQPPGIYPGQVYLLDRTVGGYDVDHGWTGERAKNDSQYVTPNRPEMADAVLDPDDGSDADPYSRTNNWQTLAQHSDAICAELTRICDALEIQEPLRSVLVTAARWHDLGKAHWVFCHALPDGIPDPFLPWAKAPKKLKWKRYARKHFRHELASALAVLQERGGLIAGGQRNLIAYLVAAHHGKVRLSIRSMPNEIKPPHSGIRFARGVWDGDELPQTDLGSKVVAPAVRLSLEPMELGLSAKGEPSWAERMLALRDDPNLGPFRLAYLEALVRAADMRVSMKVPQS